MCTVQSLAYSKSLLNADVFLHLHLYISPPNLFSLSLKQLSSACYGELAHGSPWCSSVHFSRSVVSDFVTPWTAAQQASLSITNSQSQLNFMSIESVMPSNHFILCHPLLLHSIFPSIRVFSSESVLHRRRKWKPTPVILPGKSQGQRNLVSYSPMESQSQTGLSN